ncbi:hypothetical protein E5288_WYG019865 [Bos mutus]|uniref:Uncharacterized protein n=1 Tax=Bos mutus TaxID=72004 RepID=A0A6B0RNF8_9CETA|nr:hypothetical protein [Bos mutus]
MPSTRLFGGEAPRRIPQQKARVRKGLCLMYELRLAIHPRDNAAISTTKHQSLLYTEVCETKKLVAHLFWG